MYALIRRTPLQYNSIHWLLLSIHPYWNTFLRHSAVRHMPISIKTNPLFVLTKPMYGMLRRMPLHYNHSWPNRISDNSLQKAWMLTIRRVLIYRYPLIHNGKAFYKGPSLRCPLDAIPSTPIHCFVLTKPMYTMIRWTLTITHSWPNTMLDKCSYKALIFTIRRALICCYLLIHNVTPFYKSPLNSLSAGCHFLSFILNQSTFFLTKPMYVMLCRRPLDWIAHLMIPWPSGQTWLVTVN